MNIIDQAIEELKVMAPSPMPHGIRIYASDDHSDNVLVGNDRLGFCVTKESILDKRHIVEFEASLERLIEILDKESTE